MGPVIISADVTNPGVEPFIVADRVVSNGDGSESYAIDNADGSVTWAGQEPLAYGKRNDETGPAPKEYQRFTRQGTLTSVLTRVGDPTFTYSITIGRVYPS